MSVNKVILVGHTGKDVELVRFDNGGVIGRVSVATNETYKKKDTGEKVNLTEWHNVVFRNKGAEIAEQYLKKGDLVYLEGKLKTRKWTDNSGQDKYTTEIEVNDFKFLTPKGSNNSSGRQGSAVDQYEQKQAQQKQPQGIQDEEDDLPF